LSYAEKIFDLRAHLQAFRDARQAPRIDTFRIVGSVFLLLAARLGSLHAFSRHGVSPFQRRFLGGPPPSDDTLGRVMGFIDPEQARTLLRDSFYRLKRNKAFPDLPCGLVALVLDGHEGYASYRRTWAGARARTIKTAKGDREQRYYQYVVAHLVGGGAFPFVVDLEPVGQGENEVGAAKRLLTRIELTFARDYDVVLADAIYTDASFWGLVRGFGKHVLTVLKQNRRDLLVDAKSLFDAIPPVTVRVNGGTRQRILRDVEDLRTWSQLSEPVRVVQSLETWSIRRQTTKELEPCASEWIWVTSLPASRVDATAVAELGHLRWTIENETFNEFVNRWHGDHIYRCDPTAILNFLLIAFFVFNLFHAFYHRNLKPERRKTLGPIHAGQLIASDYLEHSSYDTS
jgi:hypothetical protein